MNTMNRIHRFTLHHTLNEISTDVAASLFKEHLEQLKNQILANRQNISEQNHPGFISISQLSDDFDRHSQQFTEGFIKRQSLDIPSRTIHALGIYLNALNEILIALDTSSSSAVELPSTLRDIDLIHASNLGPRELDIQRTATSVRLWQIYSKMLGGTNTERERLRDTLRRARADLRWIDVLDEARAEPAMEQLMSLLHRCDDNSRLTLEVIETQDSLD